MDDVSIWNSTQPVFSIYPSANNFGLIALGGAGSTQDFNISNQGAGVITLDPEDITLSGANASEFYLINIAETVNIGSYESVQISVGFYPATTGLKSATLQINDNVTRAKQLQLSRDNFALRSSAQRDVHQVSLSAEVYQPDITSLPWEEDFTGIELGTLPAGWETTNVNWSTQDTSQSGGEAPELTFAYYYPGTNADFYVVSPFIDSSGMDELLLSFKQRTNHYEGDYVLKLVALVGSTEYVIQEWANPNQALAAQDLEFTLTALEHGVGAANLRIAWVFSGNSVNIDQWLIDDILLAENEIIPLTLNPPQNLIVSIVVGGVGLSWDAVNLATGYKVYSASMPNASSEDWVLEATVEGLSWSAALVDNLRFYKVIAIKEEPVRESKNK